MTKLNDDVIMRILSVIEGKLGQEHVTLEELRSFGQFLDHLEMDRLAEWQPMPGLH